MQFVIYHFCLLLAIIATGFPQNKGGKERLDETGGCC
jgi:hypothetical protein